MSQSREDLFIAAALTGLLSAYPYGRNDRIPKEVADQAIQVGKWVARVTEPFQPPVKKESTNA
jgi:hypothetical protein